MAVNDSNDIVHGADGSVTVHAPVARMVAGAPVTFLNSAACPLCMEQVTFADLPVHARACAIQHPDEFARLVRGMHATSE